MDAVQTAPRWAAARSIQSRPMQRALGLIAVLAALLAVVGADAVIGEPTAAVAGAVPSAVGLLYVAVGVVAWNRRPANRLGFLLCVTGVLFLLASLANAEQPVMLLLGVLCGQAVLAGVLHLLLAFPSGRLGGRRDRTLVAAAYLTTVVPLFVQYVFSGDPLVLPFLRAGAQPSVATAAARADEVLATVVLLVSAVLLVVRYRRSEAVPAQRRARAAVYLTGMTVLIFVPVAFLAVAPLVGLTTYGRFLLQLLALAIVPFVIALGILRGGFARTARIEDLGLWLASSPAGRRPVREALATALGDESLQLYFRPGHSDALVDGQGQPAEREPSRTSVSIDAGDGAAAIIEYDDALIGDPTPVEQAGHVVALALERERLTAELLARRLELLESRARLVEVADSERRRFAQDLHDLLQGRLVLASLHAGALGETPGLDPDVRRAVEAIRDDLLEATRELRSLVHGVMPSLLLERGLFAAAEDLLDRSPIPVDVTWAGGRRELGSAVSTGAYFILAEAVANVVKHARASSIRIRIESTEDELDIDFADDGVGGAAPTGAGLRGIRDRVDVLNGDFALDSPTGGGTRLLVRLPCD